MATFRTRVKAHISKLIDSRRRMIRRGISNRNEMEMAVMLNQLEYWTANLASDKAAALFLNKRFDQISRLLPKKQNKLQPDGIDQLRNLRNEAITMLQPTQLEIFR